MRHKVKLRRLPVEAPWYSPDYEVIWRGDNIGKLLWEICGRGTGNYGYYDRFRCLGYNVPGRGWNRNNTRYRFPHWMVQEMPALFTTQPGPVWNMDTKLSNTIFFSGDTDLGPMGPHARISETRMAFSLRDARALINGVLNAGTRNVHTYPDGRTMVWHTNRPGFDIYNEGPVNMARYIDNLLEIEKFEREARKGGKGETK